MKAQGSVGSGELIRWSGRPSKQFEADPSWHEDVCLGSKPEVPALRRDVCFTPVSGHRQAVSACPKSADCVEKLENRGAPKIWQM